MQRRDTVPVLEQLPSCEGQRLGKALGVRAQTRLEGWGGAGVVCPGDGVCVCVCVCTQSLSHVRLFATP